ncbi:hypothetical protein HYV84_05080 [Candidatus Woesearchaeota archaeon]|nr:hypothetical protein [Candidatus Woesearchaeota archaeon]
MIRIKERRRINRIIGRAVNYIVSELQGKGLVAAYKTGTILTRDQVYDSDIDIAIIVEPGFDFNLVAAINEHFEKERQEFSDGFKIGAFALGIDEITAPYNDKSNNPITRLRLSYRMLKALARYGELRWGKRLPLGAFVRDFSHESATYFTPLEEAKNQIGYILSEIKKIREGDYTQYRKLPKYCLILIRCEAMVEHNFKYDPSFYSLYKHMKHLEDHIIHKCIELRAKAGFSAQEALTFCDEIETYIIECQKKINARVWR